MFLISSTLLKTTRNVKKNNNRHKVKAESFSYTFIVVTTSEFTTVGIAAKVKK